jgi:hypothetical protein
VLISSKKVLCLAMSALTAFSVCLTGCGKERRTGGRTGIVRKEQLI